MDRFETLSSDQKITYNYVDYKPWGRIHNKSYDEAGYPETICTAIYSPGCQIEFPSEDFITQAPNGKPLLFTGSHNRILQYLYEENREPKPRTLFLVDNREHSDWNMGISNDHEDQFNKVHTGNWGSAGASLRQWNYVVHLSEDLKEGMFEFRTDKTKGSQPVPFERKSFGSFVKGKGPVLPTGQRYILTIDSDGFEPQWQSPNGLTGYDEKKCQQNKLILGKLVTQAVHDDNCDLVHFTPSPLFNSKANAVRVWEDVLAAVTKEPQRNQRFHFFNFNLRDLIANR